MQQLPEESGMSGLGVLSRLEPASTQWETRVDGGWIAEIDAALLAGALGKMSADQSAMARVIVLNDHKALRYITARVRGMLLSSNLSMDEQTVLADIVVRAVVMPDICPTCDGHAEYMHGALLVPCPSCGGTGKRIAPGHEHGWARGIDRHDWAQKFETDYERGRAILLGWWSGAARILHEQMDG